MFVSQIVKFIHSLYCHKMNNDCINIPAGITLVVADVHALSTKSYPIITVIMTITLENILKF